jgi:hypothetical protein
LVFWLFNLFVCLFGNLAPKVIFWKSLFSSQNFSGNILQTLSCNVESSTPRQGAWVLQAHPGGFPSIGKPSNILTACLVLSWVVGGELWADEKNRFMVVDYGARRSLALNWPSRATTIFSGRSYGSELAGWVSVSISSPLVLS